MCRYEITGAVFSRDGSEVVTTVLGDKIYVFDTFRSFEKEYDSAAMLSWCLRRDAQIRA